MEILIGNMDGRRLQALLAHVFRRTALPFLLKHTVSVAKLLEVDLLETAVAEIADVVSFQEKYQVSTN